MAKGDVKDTTLKKPSKSQGKYEKISTKDGVTFKPADMVKLQDGKFRDHYSVGPELGKGAFGEVRRCVHKISKQVRAVKIIRKDKLDQAEQKRLFVEIETLKNLDHPNILRVYEVFADAKRFYIVTELVTGGELFDQIVKRNQFNEADASNVIREVLEAVAYCHSHNIVH